MMKKRKAITVVSTCCWSRDLFKKMKQNHSKTKQKQGNITGASKISRRKENSRVKIFHVIFCPSLPQGSNKGMKMFEKCAGN